MCAIVLIHIIRRICCIPVNISRDTLLCCALYFVLGLIFIYVYLLTISSFLDSVFADLQDEMGQAEANGECRYVVYDYKFTGHEGAREKLLFLFW